MRYNFMVLSHTLSSQFKSRFGIQDADYLHTRTFDPLEVKFIALRIFLPRRFRKAKRSAAKKGSEMKIRKCIFHFSPGIACPKTRQDKKFSRIPRNS
jgi:hypothetical protein